MSSPLRPVPKPPARPKKAHGWGSTLSAGKGLPKKRTTPRRPRDLECRAYLDWCKTQPCFLTGLRTGDYTEYQGAMIRVEVDPSHAVKTVGARGGDLYFALPCARHIHDQEHQMGRTSWRRFHGLTEQSVKDLAAYHTEQWMGKFPDLVPKDDDPNE